MNVVLRGKYQIVREIARSNDIVYEANDTTLGRRVALKELNLAPGMTGQAHRERVERFNREARAAGRLNHPNIVSIFDVGEENGRYFIAMEYLEGQNLRDLLQVRGTLPLKEALQIAYQMLDAIAYAHNHRVIHRDIKPDNIHVLPGGTVKLTDFGIARLTEEPQLTSNGQVFGTPSYMSPEQIEGRSIDHRSDLFSLGIVLYEMLTGRKPFVGDSVVSITYAIMHAEMPPMSGVPMGVEQVVRRALSKQPQGRQASAEQMKMDLQAAEQTPPMFFASSGMATNLRQTGGIGTVYPPQGPNQTGAPGYAGTSLSGPLAAHIPPVPTPYPTAPPPATAGSLPWSWNGNGPPGGNPPPIPVLPQQAPVPAFGTPPGFPPGNVPPGGQVAIPSEPVFTLTPAGRTMLLSVLLALVLGGGIALGVVGFQNSYEQYRAKVGAQQIAVLINQGVTAYDGRDYPAAIKAFEQALSAQPDGTQRATVNHNLTASYIQMARVDKANGKLTEAQNLYQKALAISPNDSVAHSDLAALLEAMGRPQDAQRERAATADVSTATSVSESLRVDPGTGHGTTPMETASGQPANGDATPLVSDRRSKAEQLIRDGIELQRQGDVEGARQKWRDAITLAPGTPERDMAQQYLDNTEPPSDPGN